MCFPLVRAKCIVCLGVARFRLLWLTLFVLPYSVLTAGVVINEIHYDEDNPTIHSEFIELYNGAAAAVDLSGWFFEKGIYYTFPSGTTLAPGAYLVVCEDPATLQSKWGVSGTGVMSWQAPGPPKFDSLKNAGEEIVLRDVSGVVVDEVDYARGFPWPTVGDVPSYSIELINPSLQNELGGNWRASKNGSLAGPTPRAVNAVFAANAPPAVRHVAHVPTNPLAGQPWISSGEDVRVTAKVTDPDGIQTVALEYQIVEPGDYVKDDDPRYNASVSWNLVPMHDDGENGDLIANDSEFSCLIPGPVQTHRRLVRYRISGADTLGASVRVPYPDDPQLNFAYFIYDGVPAWSGSKRPGVAAPVLYQSPLLTTLPQYHLITRIAEHSNAQDVPVIKIDGTPNNPGAGAYTHSQYLWKGALCYDGVVYDHIRFRARGGVWRFAMGKNMWKFQFNRGHDFVARDNYGRSYDQHWKRLNFSSVIQQGDFNHRGEQGLFESVGFRLFQLSGLAAENTHFVHFRIIERPSETNNSANQFDDDFQGLYLAVEQQGGQFLEEHGLPAGNLYKMEGGSGTLKNQGPVQPSNKSDLNAFLSYGSTEQFWRNNCELVDYYNYRAIVDCIHHYDIGDGKNYYYYHNPETNKWSALPWDLDLTWSDNMYRSDGGIEGLPPSGNPTEPFFTRIFGNGSTTGIAALRMEHRNRVRELLDLLFNAEQTGMLINEMASFIYQPNQPSFVDADRAMWDYNPILVSSFVNGSKAGHGRFYQSAVDNPATPESEVGSFAGMMQKMKNYIATRRNVITTQLLTTAEENLVPATPVVTAVAGIAAPIPTDALTFSSSAFAGKNGAAFAGIKWRIAEVTDPEAPGYLPFDHTSRRLYEADRANAWESSELNSFNDTYTFPAVAAKTGGSYRVRVKHRDGTGRWSHWSAPLSFIAGTPNIAVYLQSLVVSAMMVSPAFPSPEERAVAQDNDSFEWIELLNVGQATLDLAPVRFTKGVHFDFADSAVTTLAPGAKVLVVNNLAAFNARYGALPPGMQIAGAWQPGDNLNNGGEEVKLSHGAGVPIRAFAYDDAPPWPSAMDAGYALVLMNPMSLPDHNLGTNWRASIRLHGAPGLGDATSFARWATDTGASSPVMDEDNDGLVDLAEYVLGGSPQADSQNIMPKVGVATFFGEEYSTYSFRRNLAADDVSITVQISDDLQTWHSDAGHVLFVSEANVGDGTTTAMYRSATAASPKTREFFRLLLQQK